MDFRKKKSGFLWTYLAFILLLIGGFNVGLYGIMSINVLHLILGGFTARLLFIGVGVSAFYLSYQTLKKGIKSLFSS